MAIGLLLNGEMFGILHNPSLPFQGSGEKKEPTFSNVVLATLEAKAVLVLHIPRLFLHGSGEEFPTTCTQLEGAPMDTVWNTTAQSTLHHLLEAYMTT